MKKTIFLFLLFVFINNVFPEIITRLPVTGKIIALTFDACETTTPSYFDKSILNYLIDNKIPCTFFISGKFAQRNEIELKNISNLSFIEIENHSLNHIQNMEKLDKASIVNEVLQNENILKSITGKKPKFFRFPGGNCDSTSISIVEDLGYKITHWDFASGDPDKKETPKKEIEWVLKKTRASSILIFHINGRGYSTGTALPKIVDGLKNHGYTFVKLEDYL